jgi:metallo-beta-lactamase family protein
VYCTAATRDLLEVMLLDAAHLQEEDADRANRYRYSKHSPARPLYETADAEAALRLLEVRTYGTPFAVGGSETTALFRRAGHILGSSTVELAVAGQRVVFSGDLGRWDRPILHDPELVPEADVLLVESTYGDRTHAPHPEETLAALLNEVADQRRVLVVPSFAVGRTQELIWWIRRLEEQKRIPVLPVFVDSPMAIEVTDIYARHPEEHNAAMAAVNRDGLALRTGEFRLVHRPEESRALNPRGGPMVIISASGMATGGRVLHHLAHRLPDERTTVLLPGFQAAGTRGRSLQEGASEIRIHGQNVKVRAKVVMLDGLSAHADRDEILTWLRGFRRPPRVTWVVHGEPQPADRLAATIRADYGWDARVAEDRAVVPIA